MEENLNKTEDLQDFENDNNASSEFCIPEEYQNKGWAKLYEGKSGDELMSELFKSYDNAQSIIGKKVEEYIKTTDLKNLENYEDIKEALQKQIMPESIPPEDINDYGLNSIMEDGNAKALMIEDETLKFFGNKFKEFGIPAELGKKIFKTYIEHGVKEFQKLTNADELENNISDMFKNNKEQRSTVESLIKEFLPKEDLAIIQNSVPNKIIEMFYKVGKGLVDKYGFKESSTNSINPAQMRMSEADKNAEYNRLCNRLIELDNSPHQKVGEREEIVKLMRQIFQ